MNILNFENQRKERISHYLVTFQAAFHFVVIIWYLQFVAVDFASMEAFTVLMVINLLGLVTIGFLGRITLESGKKGLLVDIFIITLYIITVFFWVYLTDSFAIQTLFVIPMIIIIIKYGRKIGLTIAVIVVLTFFATELIIGTIQYNIEALLIFSFVSLLIIWLIGSLLETEEQMRKSLIEIVFRDSCILENNDTGVIYIDNKNIVQIFNTAAEDLVGISKDNVLEKPADFTKNNYLADIFDSYRKSDKGDLNKQSIFIKDNYNLINISLIHNSKGEYLGKLVMIKNLSQTNVLHILQQQVNFITESIAMPIITISLAGKVTFLNAEACNFFVISKHRAISEHYRELFCDSFCGYIEKVLQLPVDILNDKLILDHTVMESREILISAGITKDIEGKMQGVTFLINDVTELRKKERELVQAEKLVAIAEVAAGVAHEIRNPLAVIKGIVQMMQKRAEPGTLSHSFDVVVKEADRATSILKDFMAFTKPANPIFTEQPLKQIFSEIFDLIEAHCVSYEAELAVKYVDIKNPLVNWDEELIIQVFINLALNALKAMKNSKIKRIEISIEKDQKDKNIIVRFKDTGSGMEENILKEIFNPFFTTDKKEGTGLGLSISYKIIERHNGRVSVESKKGEGTIFVVELPMNPNDSI